MTPSARASRHNQLKLLRERGGDMILFSPKASGMEHHVRDPATSGLGRGRATTWSIAWSACFPNTSPVSASCRRPPTGHSTTLSKSSGDASRISDFVGCNLNPDPSGGYWTSKPLTDEYWYPLYEKMVELDVPAMIHVSASCNLNFHALGAHYLNADTTAFMQLIQGDLFSDFPTLRFVIPHGGGAVAVPLGSLSRSRRQAGPSTALGEHVMKNVFFDTCVYHQAGIDLLHRVIDSTTSSSPRRCSAPSTVSTRRRASPGMTRSDISMS